jgi:two-component system response regulator AlgR
MDPLTLLVVDDEPLARLRLRQLVQALPDAAAEVTAEAADAASALAWLERERCDAVLLDIGLPGPSGLAFAERLRALPAPPAVVFVTAHPGHALKAFELDAVDYLTKPVRKERLLATLQRLHQRRGSGTPPAGGAAFAARAESPVLVVTQRGRLLRLPHAEILYLKAEQKTVTVRTARGSVVIDESLNELEQRLGPGFLRVHRNALVATAAIRALELRAGSDDDGGEGWAVQVGPGDEWLAVSRRQVMAVKSALKAPAPSGGRA